MAKVVHSQTWAKAAKVGKAEAWADWAEAWAHVARALGQEAEA